MNWLLAILPNPPFGKPSLRGEKKKTVGSLFGILHSFAKKISGTAIQKLESKIRTDREP